MILRGQTSPRLGWTTALGVFGLAVLLLPLVPGFSPAQKRTEPTTPAKSGLEQLDPDSRARLQIEIQMLIEKRVAEAERKHRLRLTLTEARTENDDQDRRAAQIQALKADIAAKMAAVKQFEAKAEETKGSTTANYRKRLTGNPNQGVTIHIEIHDVNDPTAVKGIIGKIEKALEGHKKTVTLHVNRPGASTATSGGSTPPTPRKPGFDVKRSPSDSSSGNVKPGSDVKRSPSDPSSRNVKTNPSPDHRIEALEKKLDAVLRELEALRQSKNSGKDGVRKEAPGNTPKKPGTPERGTKNAPQP